MRSLALGVVVAISVLLGAGVASAEKVRTNQTTKLLARPGEQAKILLTVKSGQNMMLLSQDGRWLKVRVNGRTGYVPRSKVDMADDSGIARNTRRRAFVDGRGKKRGFGGESAPDDRVGADATGDTGSSGDDGDSSSSDDEDDAKPKKTPAKAAPAKAAASKGKQDESDEDDEDETPAPKKATPAPKPAAKPAPKAAAKASDEDDEEDDEEADDKPAKAAAKPAAKPAEKPAPKAAKPDKGDDEDDEDGDSGDDEKPAPKKGAKPDKADKGDKGDDDEDESPVPKKKAESDEREIAHVRKKVSIYEKPDSESDEEFVARPTDMLFPKEEKHGWTHVENAEGDSGWIESDELEAGGGAPAAGKPLINIGARAGLTIIQQGMRTAGSNVLQVPDNYNIGTQSATLSIGASVLVPRGKALLGGEFTYDYSKALGGGVAFDPDGPDGAMPTARIGITLHNVNVRGIAGLDFKKKNGMALLGHLGYRYQGFLISDVIDFTKNPARLPSEVVKGPTLGAAFVIPRVTDKIGIRFSLDSMLFGSSVKQTVGLEDGSSPSVKAIDLGIGFTYRLKSIELAAAYDLNYMGIDFGAPIATSMRNHMGTSVSRTDIFHMVTFGIAKPF